jgi:hypothetical protein
MISCYSHLIDVKLRFSEVKQLAQRYTIIKTQKPKFKLSMLCYEAFQSYHFLTLYLRETKIG